MKKIFTFLFCTSILSNVFSQNFQGTIKPGTTTNSVICAIRPTANLSDKPVNIQLAIAIPQSVGSRPVMTIMSNRYSTFFNAANTFQSATYLTDYIYLVDLGNPTLTTNKTYTTNVEDTVLELSFTGNIGNRSEIRLVQLPNGTATGAGSENGQYNFFTQFAVTGERTNETAMFYSTTGGVVVNNPAGYAGYSTVSAGSGVVPVKWVDFSVVKQNNSAVLRWEVANQVNNDYYEVQAGKDVQSLKSIGHVSSFENKRVYNFSDVNLSKLQGEYAYYRIKQVDKDGKSTFSEIRKLQLAAKAFTFNIAGNPVVGSKLNISIQSLNSNKGLLKIFDLNGKQVYQSNISWTVGNSQQIIAIPDLPSGTYSC